MSSLPRKTPMPPRQTRMARGPMKKGKAYRVRKRRRKSEFARIYGSKQRVEFVKSLRCCVPACWWRGIPSENAHVAGGGGMGYKAGAEAIAPLCPGHHRLLHSWGAKTFQAICHVDLSAAAARVEAAWQATQEANQ